MLFKILPKSELAGLFAALSENDIIGPVHKGDNRAGTPLFDFARVTDFDTLRLDFTSTVHSAKRFVLPYRETLSTFRITKDSWEKQVDFNIERPFVLFGLHACDINALNKLDKVLMGSVYPTPYYAAKRRNMFIIGIDCIPLSSCFCRSMGTDTALTGFDLFLTDLGERYFVEIRSAKAFQFLKGLSLSDPADSDHDLYLDKNTAMNAAFVAHVETSDLTKILDLEFESPVWKDWGARCLSCGTCANVCPTCYCYGVEETVALDLSSARKEKQLHSCNLVDFAEVAGGHNFRPESASRLKYRYYHKHRGFVEAFEESLCVGCGRCGRSCLAEINVPDVIASIRHEEMVSDR
ncbi:MAG: 4Fe-4S dicluster domain-containing protein [Proteobacteria bacterium]|nr:4Fe-4S dicluster domain-containing protein [Pseudomonadota bacterium]MBU1687211.1 4Fe-4S dicluster domain-containing protein [Pseudomonadota bacterium]